MLKLCDKIGISFHLALMSLAAGLAANFQFGYLSSVLAPPYVEIEHYINSSLTERSGSPVDEETIKIIMSALNISNVVAGMIGQLMALFICDRIGRRKAALLGCLVTFPGVLLSLAAKWLQPAFEVLFAGRFIWSMANGLLSIVQTIWLVESAPAVHRGAVSAMQEVLGGLGGLAAQGFGAPLSTETLWPLIFVFPLIVNAGCTIMFYFTHDSQQFLLIRQKAIEAAKKAIAAYYGTKDNRIIEEQLLACKQNGESTSDKNTENPAVHAIDIIFRPWKTSDEFSSILRRAAWIGVLVKIAYIFTGARAIRAFSTYVLHEMGGWSYSDARYYEFFTGIVRMPFTLIPIFVIDRLGRRPLILGSGGLSIVFLAMLIFTILKGETFKVATLIAVAALFTVNFSIGLGSVSGFYASELVPRQLLLKSITILAIIEAVVKIVVEFLFYPLVNVAHAYIFFFFLIPSIFFFALMWHFCPETKGTYVNDVLNRIAKQKGVDVRFHECPCATVIVPDPVAVNVVERF